MGKPSGTRNRAQKRQIIAFSKSKMPDLIPEQGSPSFKETKRRSILAGLRVMKAPAVAGMERATQGDVQVHIYSKNISIYSTILFKYSKKQKILFLRYKGVLIYFTDHPKIFLEPIIIYFVHP